MDTITEALKQLIEELQKHDLPDLCGVRGCASYADDGVINRLVILKKRYYGGIREHWVYRPAAVCDECFDDCTECNCCNERYQSGADFTWLRQGDAVCSDCNNEIFYCDSCEEYFYMDDRNTDDRGGEFCDNCFEDPYAYCDECEGEHRRSRSCAPRSSIAGYGVKPAGGFVPSGETFAPLKDCHFGLEIELECGDGDRYAFAERVAQLLQPLGDRGILNTYDGSLVDGFEITTHPLSLDVWRGSLDLLEQGLGYLRAQGCRAWDANTATHPVGIHIHASLDGFRDDLHIAHYFHLFRTLEAAWVRAAGRRSVSYANFERLTNIAGKAKGVWSTQHGDAIHRTDETLELRIWRSSLLPARILGDVECTAAAIAFSRDHVSVRSLMRPKQLEIQFAEYLAAEGYSLGARVFAGERFSAGDVTPSSVTDAEQS